MKDKIQKLIDDFVTDMQVKMREDGACVIEQIQELITGNENLQLVLDKIKEVKELANSARYNAEEMRGYAEAVRDEAESALDNSQQAEDYAQEAVDILKDMINA